jgi:hypothetical protein
MTEFAQMDIFFIVTTFVVAFVGLLFAFVLYKIWRLLSEVEYFMHEVREETTLLRGDIAKVRHNLEKGFRVKGILAIAKRAFTEFTKRRSTKE